MNKTERERPDWHTYGMSLAYAARVRSPDIHYTVGACALRRDHSVAATGYNGAPPGVEIDWTDRDARRPLVDHAEHNCLKYTIPGEVYYLYVTLIPCENCFEKLKLHGVKEVFYSENYKNDTSVLDKAARSGIVMVNLKFNPYDYYTIQFKQPLLCGNAYGQDDNCSARVVL